MKNIIPGLLLIGVLSFGNQSCNTATNAESQAAEASSPVAAPEQGQSSVEDDVSQKNIVQIASGSQDHTTLVQAVKAAKLVDVLANAGPFTVFAPTNAAFEALPKGTVEGLLEPDKIGTLQDILQYHVSVGVFTQENMTDGQVLGQANDGKVTISVKDGTYFVNGVKIIASIPASNGYIHVVEGVLLPSEKK